MTGQTGTVGRRFRITLEGVTHYISKDGTGADVTLSIPGPGYSLRTYVTAMPTDGFEWLPEPAKVGDTIDGSDAFEALPVNAVVLDGVGVGVKCVDGSWRYSDDPGGVLHPSNTATLIYLPDVTP